MDVPERAAMAMAIVVGGRYMTLGPRLRLFGATASEQFELSPDDEQLPSGME